MSCKKISLITTLLLGLIPFSAQATSTPQKETAQTTVATPHQKLKIVATFSILYDVLKNVGGERIEADVIVGPNQDTHVFEPTPDTNKIILGADAIFLNGLGFETWLERLIKATDYKGFIFDVSKGIQARTVIDPDYGNKPVFDPHVWGDIKNVMQWVENIKNALIDIDPEGKAIYETNAKNYLEKLKALDESIYKSYQDISDGKCKVITAHDAFEYYGAAYGVTFLAPSGLSTNDEPSAAEMAELIKLIHKEGIKTIFVENISSQHLIQQLASETGAKIGGTLFSDALSRPDQGSDTYLKMMQHNTKILLSSLTCFAKKP